MALVSFRRSSRVLRSSGGAAAAGAFAGAVAGRGFRGCGLGRLVCRRGFRRRGLRFGSGLGSGRGRPSQGPAPPFRTQAVVTRAQWGRRRQPPITQIQCRDEGLSFFYDRHYETEDRVLAERTLSPHQRSDRRDGGHPPESGRREVQGHGGIFPLPMRRLEEQAVSATAPTAPTAFATRNSPIRRRTSARRTPASRSRSSTTAPSARTPATAPTVSRKCSRRKARPGSIPMAPRSRGSSRPSRSVPRGRSATPSAGRKSSIARGRPASPSRRMARTRCQAAWSSRASRSAMAHRRSTTRSADAARRRTSPSATGRTGRSSSRTRS
jgi:hypothetical protein